MKMSISISDRVARQVGMHVKEHDSNASAVVESALRAFALLSPVERQKLVRETHASKKALTRTGWMSVFWDVIAEEFDGSDFARGDIDRIMAPRTHSGFTVVFLLHDVRDSATRTADFMVHVFESPPHDANRQYTSQTFSFNMEDSVYDAARRTAAWIREHPLVGMQ